jgi:hypothetical protein
MYVYLAAMRTGALLSLRMMSRQPWQSMTDSAAELAAACRETGSACSDRVWCQVELAVSYLCCEVMLSCWEEIGAASRLGSVE